MGHFRWLRKEAERSHKYKNEREIHIVRHFKKQEAKSTQSEHQITHEVVNNSNVQYIIVENNECVNEDDYLRFKIPKTEVASPARSKGQFQTYILLNKSVFYPGERVVKQYLRPILIVKCTHNTNRNIL